MADITLAELNGRFWLVGGEAYLHELLGNTLPDTVSTEVVLCEHPSQVHKLWVRHCGEPETGGTPWQIHPNIVARFRRSITDQSIVFGQWSALLDEEALEAVAATALRMSHLPDAAVELVQYLDPTGAQAVADLTRLRCQLIEDKLAEAGVARSRIGRVVRPLSDLPDGASGPNPQRIDLVVRGG